MILRLDFEATLYFQLQKAYISILIFRHSGFCRFAVGCIYNKRRRNFIFDTASIFYKLQGEKPLPASKKII